MDKQKSFSIVEYSKRKKISKREEFLKRCGLKENITKRSINGSKENVTQTPKK